MVKDKDVEQKATDPQKQSFLKRMSDGIAHYGNNLFSSKYVKYIASIASSALSAIGITQASGIDQVSSIMETGTSGAEVTQMALDNKGKPPLKNRIINGLKTVGYHAAKILSSKPVLIASQLVGAGIAIAAAAAGGPITAGLAAGFTLASVVTKVVVDTVQAKRFNELVKENKRLVEYTDSKDRQMELLEQHPQLRVLKDKIFIPENESKRSLTNQHSITSEERVIAKGIGKAALKKLADFGTSVLDLVGVVASGPISILTKTGGLVLQAVSLGFLSKDTITVDQSREALKERINTLRNNPDSPEYTNSKELQDQVRVERIKTAALEKLTQDAEYLNIIKSDPAVTDPKTSKLIQDRFNVLKIEIESNEKKLSSDIFARAGKAVWGVVKDIIRSQNPYSEFNNIDSVKIDMSSRDAKKSVPQTHDSATNVDATRTLTQEEKRVKVENNTPETQQQTSQRRYAMDLRSSLVSNEAPRDLETPQSGQSFKQKHSVHTKG